MKIRLALFAATALAVSACADTTTAPEPQATVQAVAPEVLEAKRSGTATLTGEVDQLLADGSQLTGTVQVTRIELEDGQLVVSGVLTGVSTAAGGATTAVQQSFTDVGATLTGTSATACDILNLDLGPLHLNVLGLVVDLEPVVLDIVAQPGSGNLLGNLLCAVVRLLDGPGLFAAISSLLNQINILLGAL